MPDDNARLIVAALEQANWPRTVATLAASTGLRQPLVAKTLDRLAGEGVVQRVRRGVYMLHR